ncbi:MAG: hypothetical protein AAGL69_15065 [Pseudomonadota bacterium]
MLRSSQLSSEGKTTAALEALENAGRVSDSKVYFADTVALSERALAAVSDYAFVERAGTAFGVGARAGLPSFSRATTMCREASETSAQWAQACERYGVQGETLGESELEVSVAQTIQKIVREAVGDQRGADQIQLRMDARRDVRIGQDAEFTLLSMMFLLSDPASFSSYLNDIRVNGELTALQLFNATLEQRLSDQPDLVCTALDALVSEWDKRSALLEQEL